MTTKDDFLRDCIDSEDGTRLDQTQRRREAERFLNLSDYHNKGVDDHLDGEAKLLAIKQGYYAMLHRANAALALAGFKVTSHACTIEGLTGLFDESDLADDLRQAFEERLNVDYEIHPERPELGEFENAHAFVENTMQPFLKKGGRDYSGTRVVRNGFVRAM